MSTGPLHTDVGSFRLCGIVEQVDCSMKRPGTTRSAFREALRDALGRLDEKDLEEQHIAGYRRYPVRPDEFDAPEADLAWGDGAWSTD